MLSPKSFKSDPQLHCRIPVCAYKLVMFQLDNISLFIRNDSGHIDQLTRLVRQEHGHCKDSVPLDKPQLYNA